VFTLAAYGVSISGLSDPFCRAAVYDSKKKAGKGYQTPIIKKTLNPVWKNPEVLTMYAA
jgi:Ca2+-dependent lipid-binding protein